MWSDWVQFFAAQFVSLKGLRGFQIFRFHHDSPGYVLCKKSSDDAEVPVRLLKCDVMQFVHDARPGEITPGGLTRERQAYLYGRIRPFVTNPWKDVSCPPSSKRRITSPHKNLCHSILICVSYIMNCKVLLVYIVICKMIINVILENIDVIMKIY